MVVAMTVYLKEAREFQWVKQRDEEGGRQEDRAQLPEQRQEELGPLSVHLRRLSQNQNRRLERHQNGHRDRKYRHLPVRH